MLFWRMKWMASRYPVIMGILYVSSCPVQWVHVKSSGWPNLNSRTKNRTQERWFSSVCFRYEAVPQNFELNFQAVQKHQNYSVWNEFWKKVLSTKNLKRLDPAKVTFLRENPFWFFPRMVIGSPNLISGLLSWQKTQSAVLMIFVSDESSTRYDVIKPSYFGDESSDTEILSTALFVQITVPKSDRGYLSPF